MSTTKEDNFVISKSFPSFLDLKSFFVRTSLLLVALGFASSDLTRSAKR
jgi:hypothetical protein